MDMLRTQLYTLDHLLKELSVQIALNDTHNEIRDLVREASMMMECGRYHGEHTPTIKDMLRDFVYGHLKRHIPEEYLFYGRIEAERIGHRRIGDYSFAGSR